MTNKKIVIGIAGNIGAGKGTVTEYLKEKYQAKQMRYSKILADILERLYLEYNRDNLDTIAEGLRNMFGEDILSRVLEQDIQEQDVELVVFDGIRKKEELDYFKEKSDNFVFVFVDAPVETIVKRLLIPKSIEISFSLSNIIFFLSILNCFLSSQTISNQKHSPYGTNRISFIFPFCSVS